MKNGLTIEDLIFAVRRRWFVIALPTVFGGAFAVALALILPATYSSTARILVESQQIPSELARSTVTSDATERIRLIEQRLMRRENLLDIAERFEIFPENASLSPSDKVEAMRSATTISNEVLATQGRGQVTASAVNITFETFNPALAARVANEFLELMLTQNIQVRNRRATDTLAFFDQEVDRLGADLARLQGEITRFKSANEQALPGSLSFRRNELSSLQEAQLEREVRIAALEKERRDLRALADEGVLTAGTQGRVSPEERELLQLRSQLTQQQAIYAPSHPLLRNLSARIAALEASLRPAADSGPEAGATTGGALARQLDVIETQLSLLEQQQAANIERQDALRISIDRTPEVETTLTTLQREFDNIQFQYEQAVLKQAEAAVGERLEVNQQAERFEVIEQPQTPQRPDSPNRALIVAIGVTLSLGLGCGLALLAEVLNRTLRTPGEFERALDMRPVAVIPYIRTAAEVRLRKWSIRGAFATALIAAPGALYAVDQYVMPLPLVIEKVLDRSGVSSVARMASTRFGG